jgi:hypothetical protein
VKILAEERIRRYHVEYDEAETVLLKRIGFLPPYAEPQARLWLTHAEIEETKVMLARRPRAPGTATEPRLVRAPEVIAKLSSDDLLALYCRVMGDVAEVFIKYETYVVRVWDGMDGCWTDCTGEVGREEALRAWADQTDGGAHHVSYAEIDYYRIFPGGMRMNWDGSEGREMHR